MMSDAAWAAQTPAIAEPRESCLSDQLRATIAAQDREITRLRAWLTYIGHDDPDARNALRGDSPPTDGKG